MARIVKKTLRTRQKADKFFPETMAKFVKMADGSNLEEKLAGGGVIVIESTTGITDGSSDWSIILPLYHYIETGEIFNVAMKYEEENYLQVKKVDGYELEDGYYNVSFGSMGIEFPPIAFKDFYETFAAMQAAELATEGFSAADMALTVCEPLTWFFDDEEEVPCFIDTQNRALFTDADGYLYTFTPNAGGTAIGSVSVSTHNVSEIDDLEGTIAVAIPLEVAQGLVGLPLGSGGDIGDIH